jgi:glycosyltransferase involved in cell wall biosynthesis
MDAQGTHPLRDAALCWRLLTVMRREQPDVVLGYTIKPNVYASLAARWAGGVKVVNNIAGLGATFIQPTWVTPVVKRLYRLALNRSSTVFFQNEDDRELFVDQGLVARGNTQLLPGSGVDLQRYAPAAPRAADGRFRFLMVSRLLWDKGVGELVEAARRLRLRHPEVQVQLLGFLDVQNPSAIQRRDVQAWESEGVIQYLGASDDPRPYIAHSDCVVLPSYREGTPRSLLEAAAMGKPLITTDVPGCRTVVEDGNNGLLCPARDATALADQMSRMVMLNAAERDAMGRQGRQKMEREFDERLVIGHYRRAIAKALQPDRRP